MSRALGYGGRESLGEIPQTPSAESRNATGDGVTERKDVREARATQVPAGYKRTEAGVIPEGWRASTVGAEFRVQLGKMLDAAKNAGVAKPYIGNRSVQWGRIDVTDIDTVALTSADLHRFRLRSGDLLVCEGGEIGRAAIWDAPIRECYFQKALHRLRPSRGYDVYLMMSMLQRWALIGYLADYVTQTSIAHLPKDKFETVPLPVPTATEQRAIAAVLSDVDGLIGSLEALIAKKRAIKRAAMQQLLTGRTRLPGFEGEWEAASLGVLVEIRNGGTPSTTVPDYWDGSIPWCTPTDITGTSGRELVATARSITSSGLDSCGASLLPAGALLLCSRATIGELKIAAMPVATNQGFKSLVCGGSVDHEYLYYRLLPLKDEMAGLATGSTFLEISKRDVASIRIHLPQLAEQRAIAAVLSDMDAEIAALERRLDKTLAIKQGMMQQLLTGATRLPIPDDGLEGGSHDA